MVSPHPDDSAVSSGATIRALFEQNNVTIMAMTSGYRAAIPGADKKKRIAARKKEALAEAKKLQADLLFPEFHFYDQGRKKWKQDLKKFGKLWKSINPSVVILPHQYDEHPTHRYSTALVEDYIKQEKVKQLELWYYESVWSQHLLTSISQVFCYNEELHDVKNAAINSHTSQVKRIPLVEITENLSRFRALTIPEQKFVTYGQEPINLSSFVEAYHIEKR
ncbi:MAG: PIG-L deacetylase family protein [Patescibacteria group bacterium]